MARQLGDQKTADEYTALARAYAQRWVAMDQDGDHYALTFDKAAGSWSQKYNLVWDRILGLNLFPQSVMETETAFYQKNLNRYGLPLDNRQPYTKLDWTVWTATLTTAPDDFRALVSPLYDWISATPSRVPLTDWFDTKSGRQSGFQARSVVGGLAIKMLADPVMWHKWADRATKQVAQR